MLDRLPHWAQKLIIGVLSAAGGWGLFLIAFVDSSFGTLPIINDALVIALSLQRPEMMPFYVAMATLGSVAGCSLGDREGVQQESPFMGKYGPKAIKWLPGQGSNLRPSD